MILESLYTDKKYGILYVDPPWPQRKTLLKVRPNQQRELDYQTMSLGEIEEYQKQIVSLADERCNCFLWTIEKYLSDAENMMKKLGWKIHVRMIWDKIIGVPAAFTVRFTHEYLLWCYRGGHILRPVQEERGKFGTVMRERSTYHSHKPQIAYEMIERMFPDVPKLEVYARNTREGWDSFGNEL